MPVIETTLEQLRDDGEYDDWKEVFKREYASPVIFSDSTVSKDPFDRENVKEVIASVDGENDEKDWVMVGLLHYGRYFKINAGCDYTGWG